MGLRGGANVGSPEQPREATTEEEVRYRVCHARSLLRRGRVASQRERRTKDKDQLMQVQRAAIKMACLSSNLAPRSRLCVFDREREREKERERERKHHECMRQ